MGEHRYHFVSHWTAAAPGAAAYAALHAVSRYPTWWPEVKMVRKLDADRFWLRTRSILPYDLSFSLDRQIADPAAGVLEAMLRGDLEGRIRWTIEPAAGGCRITFDEDVVTNKTALHALAPIARPAFVANHGLMMAHGQAGLRTFLSGYAFGREPGEAPGSR
ncbi:MAG TPA: SRPBCC family protein [Candidatus Limnocylindria bacterium]